MTVLFCRCAYSDVMPAEMRTALADAFESCGSDVRVIDDLCALAAEANPLLKDLARETELTVVACYPRAVRWLFHRAGVQLPEQTRFLNMRTRDARSILAELGIDPRGPGKASESKTEPPGGWAPWYPVVDYSRCRNCGQCSSFCLFGVYGKDEHDTVTVENPRGCKNHCPACARICPAGAIIFPKHPEGPINGDDVPDDWTAVSAKEARGKTSGSLRDQLIRRKRQRLLRPDNTD